MNLQLFTASYRWITQHIFFYSVCWYILEHINVSSFLFFYLHFELCYLLWYLRISISCKRSGFHRFCILLRYLRQSLFGLGFMFEFHLGVFRELILFLFAVSISNLIVHSLRFDIVVTFDILDWHDLWSFDITHDCRILFIVGLNWCICKLLDLRKIIFIRCLFINHTILLPILWQSISPKTILFLYLNHIYIIRLYIYAFSQKHVLFKLITFCLGMRWNLNRFSYMVISFNQWFTGEAKFLWIPGTYVLALIDWHLVVKSVHI